MNRGSCHERDMLVQQLRSLGNAMLSSHNDHVDAILRRDSATADAIHTQLIKVRELRVILVGKLLEHLAEHDC